MVVAESFCDDCGQNGNKKMSLIYGELGGKILGLGGLRESYAGRKIHPGTS